MSVVLMLRLPAIAFGLPCRPDATNHGGDSYYEKPNP